MSAEIAEDWLTDDSPLFSEFLNLVGKKVESSVVDPIGPGDALLVIDMQNDFVPVSGDNPHGGRFGVPEGDHIVPIIRNLIEHFVERGATVCASRDYHPHDHASFVAQGGPFPAHCVQGTNGSQLLQPIAASLAAGVQKAGSDHVFVVFKERLFKHTRHVTSQAHGVSRPYHVASLAHVHPLIQLAVVMSEPHSSPRRFAPHHYCCLGVAWQAMHEQIDSFGAFPYADGGVGRIVNNTSGGEIGIACCMGCAAAPWTGSLVLKQSAISFCLDCDDGSTPDMNAPPDIFATLTDGQDRGMNNLQEALKPMKRLFVCGLALDFCVLDTSAHPPSTKPP